jgi:Mg2+/Co2+ transporter CorC
MQATETVLRQLQKDFRTIATDLEEIVDKILEEGITRYPVFIAAKQKIVLGIQIYERVASNLHFDFYLSPIEELIRKGVIRTEALQEFKDAYKNPLDTACVILISDNEYNFIFLPYTPSTLTNDTD